MDIEATISFDPDSIIEALADRISPSAVACEINMYRLSQEIDPDELAQFIDMDRLARACKDEEREQQINELQAQVERIERVLDAIAEALRI